MFRCVIVRFIEKFHLISVGSGGFEVTPSKSNNPLSKPKISQLSNTKIMIRTLSMVSGGIAINLCFLHEKYKPHSSADVCFARKQQAKKSAHIKSK